MSSMPIPPRPRCDCCGVVINLQTSDYCPRCGYPISVAGEERFLEESIRNLQRVATYGGAHATVANLLQRYQTRYNVLRQQRHTAPVAQNAPGVATTKPMLTQQAIAQHTPIPAMTMQNMPIAKSSIPVQQTSVMQTSATNQYSVPPPAQPMFSLRSFFADQTINIVASLGAFLILIGSLSFVVTTTNLFLAFIVVFLVHALFATVGLVFNRFSSFRFIARVYTAIFALLVPLVGFSGYRLVAGHFIQVSAPTIVAIAALYAALVYAFLAISQQFKPFGYLAVTALVLADLALAFSLHIYYWWWPVLLMPFAFAALLSVRRSTQIPLLNGNMAILREPVRVLMYACIAALLMDIVYIYIYSGAVDAFTKLSFEARFVGAIILFLLLVWTIAYLRTTQRFAWVALLSYQFLAVVTAFAYVYNWQAIEYGLLFTAVAVFYHVGTLVARQSLQRFAGLRNHMEGIPLVLVAIVPFLVAPAAPLGLFLNASNFYGTQNFVGSNTPFALLAILIGVAITVSTIFAHTGFQRMPVAPQTAWRWLLLLSGFLFTWACSIAVLLLHIPTMYAFLALTLLMLTGTIAVRRLVSVAWSNPLDVIVAGEVALTLLLNLTRQGGDTQLALLLLFAVLSYAMMFYQRRANWLCLPVLFMVFASALLWQHLRLELLLGVALPIVAVIIAKIKQPFSFTVGEGPNAARVSLFGWEWPLLGVGLLCGATVCVQDAFAPTSTIQQLLGIPFSVALELAGLALIWYIVAVLVHMKWWLGVAVGFAIVSLLMPSNSFSVLLYVPFVAALLAFAISRFTAREWGIPLYIVALLAAVRMGFAGYTGVDHDTTATAALLGFALLIYVLGVLEDALLFLWLAPCFVLWSVFNSAMFGDLYRPLLVALVCAVFGVIVSRLAYASTFSTLKKGTWFRYSLPFYVTALASAVLTGMYGMLFGSNHPFTSAIPDALFLYALVAYVVLVFERKPLWLWLVATFALWGMFLATPLSAASSFGYGALVPFTTYYLAGVALATGIVGMVTGRIAKRNSQKALAFPFSWNWPWYLVALLTIVVTVLWNYSVASVLLPSAIAYGCIFAFILLTLGITLVEQRPTFLTMPIALAIWLVIQTHWQLWQQMAALSILFLLVFAASYAWPVASTKRQTMQHKVLYTLLGLAGQVFVVLAIIAQGGLVTNIGALGHVGVGVLLLLAVQLFWYGWVQTARQPWTMYSAGLLVALAISWELSMLQQTRIEWLTLAPATYLIVVAPFLARDERVPNNHRIGQVCSILGSALLLLPTLWSSFSEASIQPTFILAGEALFLLLLGVGTHVRFFVLSGAALVVVSAMHALFLPSLGLPPSLALTIMGITLLALATALSLARHRVQAVWTRLE